MEKIVGHKFGNLFPKYMNADDLVKIMNYLYLQKSESLKNLQHTDYQHFRIDADLPNNVVVAHKVGMSDEINNDIGVVYASKPYIISIMTSDSNDKTIAQISKDVYDIMQ
jgi:beta-lactamase class C